MRCERFLLGDIELEKAFPRGIHRSLALNIKFRGARPAHAPLFNGAFRECFPTLKRSLRVLEIMGLLWIRSHKFSQVFPPRRQRTLRPLVGLKKRKIPG